MLLLLRYFLYVGGVLLALLFIVESSDEGGDVRGCDRNYVIGCLS
jgi:hypothetical protein